MAAGVGATLWTSAAIGQYGRDHRQSDETDKDKNGQVSFYSLHRFSPLANAAIRLRRVYVWPI